MKTLKKTLCLVLAVVLAVGVMVIPAYAETDSYNGFTDKDDVDYKYEEALATLTGMGIFNGKSSTNAAPKAYLTRAEAVTLIARALLGEGSWTLPKAPTQFTDVPADHFASGYVAYATEQGIVAGKSHTTFAPNDYVTGYELSKMLLVATGIKTDFTSAKWQMESGPLASQKGLLVGLEGVTDLNKWFTREEAAQIIWNAVKYSETLSFVVTDPTKKDYTVKFPEDSIGGRVFGLTAHYSYDNPSTGVDSDVFNRPNVEWSNGKTGAEREVYSNITQRPLVQFYAGQNLLVSDLRAKLGMSVSSAKGLTFKVFVDGSTASESSGTLQHLDDTTPGGKSVFLNTPPEGTRGATVSIYPGISGATYDVYVVYPYATALSANAVAGVATLNWDYTTEGASTGTDSTAYVGPLKKADVVTFNVTYKNDTTGKAVRIKSENPAMVGQITARLANSNDPYVRVNKSDKLYFSAKAVIISKDGTDVKAINHENIKVDGTYYKVWLDDAGNILALQVTDTPQTAIAFDDYGYVLEFSSKKGTVSTHAHDSEYGETKDSKLAQAKVVMVSLKTGIVGVYDLKVLEESAGVGTETWYIAGIDGTKWLHQIQITNDHNGVTNTHGTTGNSETNNDVIHGFVAYKNLGDGKYGITEVGYLNGATNGYDVETEFNLDSAVPGRIEGAAGKLYYADDNTQLFVLNGHKSIADKSRVESYKSTELTDYRMLGYVDTRTDEICASHNSASNCEYLGTGALFVTDSKTKVVKVAYVFAEDDPVILPNDYYIFLGRDESKLEDNLTWFRFIHNGKLETLAVEALDEVEDDLLLLEDDAKDAYNFPVVTLTKKGNGHIDTVTKINFATDTNVQHLNKVTAFVVDKDNGGYIVQDNIIPRYFFPTTPAVGNPFYFSAGWYVFDQATGTVKTGMKTGDLVGKDVYVFFNETVFGEISIIYIVDPLNNVN